MTTSLDLSQGWGVDRAIEPQGVLPAAAWRLDNRPGIAEDELRIDVELVRIDPAALRQMRRDTAGDDAAVRAALLETIAERGKFEEPTTGGGALLAGRVAEVGRRHPGGFRRGEHVAAVASTAALPVWLRDVSSWDGASETFAATGHAVAFARTPLIAVPDDVDVRLLLSLLDVAGTAAAMTRHVRRGDRVAIIGGAGRAGVLASVAAREAGAVVVAASVPTLHDVRLVETIGAALPVVVDPRDAVATATALAATLGGLADVTVVCADDVQIEGAALLTTRPGGTVVFGSPATSLARIAQAATACGTGFEVVLAAASSPEDVGLSLELVRSWPAVRAFVAWQAGLAGDPAVAMEEAG